MSGVHRAIAARSQAFVGSVDQHPAPRRPLPLPTLRMAGVLGKAQRPPAIEFDFAPRKILRRAPLEKRKVIRPADPSRIVLKNSDALHYWMDQFGCTAEELGIAVWEVGDSADAVRHYFGKRRIERRV